MVYPCNVLHRSLQHTRYRTTRPKTMRRLRVINIYRTLKYINLSYTTEYDSGCSRIHGHYSKKTPCLKRQFLTTAYIQLQPNHRKIFSASLFSMFFQMYDWTLNPSDHQATLFFNAKSPALSHAKSCNLNHAWTLSKTYFSLVEIHLPSHFIRIHEALSLCYENRFRLPRNYAGLHLLILNWLYIYIDTP